MAPGSSGLGKLNVGNPPSGANCAATAVGATKPACATARMKTSPPTPCIAVYTAETSRGPSPSNDTARATYASSTAPSRVQKSSDCAMPATAPTAAIHAEMSASAGGTIWLPSPRYTLYPLSSGGLCDAVTITPAAQPNSRTAKARTGVGSASGSTIAMIPAPAMMRAVSRANTSELRRASYPTTTLRSSSLATR